MTELARIAIAAMLRLPPAELDDLSRRVIVEISANERQTRKAA